MKIIGQTSLTNFTLWEMCLKELSTHVDELHIRFDQQTGNPDILKTIQDPKFLDGKIKQILISSTKWNRWNWREEQIRMLDTIKPDIVLVLDQDETFSDEIDLEIKEFWKSSREAMMFLYTNPLPTNDGRIVKYYPSKPHMKVYKWKEQLTYNPYIGYAKVTNYRNPELHWVANTKINHFCYYTPEIEKLKSEELAKRFEYEKIHGKR